MINFITLWPLMMTHLMNVEEEVMAIIDSTLILAVVFGVQAIGGWPARHSIVSTRPRGMDRRARITAHAHYACAHTTALTLFSIHAGMWNCFSGAWRNVVSISSCARRVSTRYWCS